MTARDWSMHRYRSGDEVELMALFNRTFGKNRSLEHWRWQFERNPYLPPTIIVARRDRDGLLAGSHVLMPIALNFSGERVLAGHTLDLVVHEDFRRQRMFEATARECFVWARERGMRAVIAFPNSQSCPGFVRSLGWSRVLEMRRYDRRLGLRGLLGGSRAAGLLTALPDALFRALRSPRQAAPGSEISVLAAAPADHDVLWAASAPHLAVSVWKDREYLAWRYDANPDHRFEYVVLRRGDVLAGVAVLWRSGGRVTVCDLVARHDYNAAAATMRGVIAHATRAGADRLMFLGLYPGGGAAALAGFEQRPAPENILTAAGLEDGAIDVRVRDGSAWAVCFGDADYV